jgi:archaellum component FlaC
MPKKKTTLNDLALMVKRGFDAVDERFNAVDKRFDGVDSRLDNVEGRLDRVESRIISVENRLDYFADHLGDHRRRLEKIEEKS